MYQDGLLGPELTQLERLKLIEIAVLGSKYRKHYDNYAKVYLYLIKTEDKLFNELVKIPRA